MQRIYAHSTTVRFKSIYNALIGIDKNQCKGCQIYVDLLKFESASPTLKPYHQFILSIFLVLVMVVTLLAVYYNTFLAYRDRPPFRVPVFCPHILFPRGERGLGRHNVE